MDSDTMDEIAMEIVREYLDDGVEFLTVSETAGDWVEDDYELNEEDLREIHDRTRYILNELAEALG